MNSHDECSTSTHAAKLNTANRALTYDCVLGGILLILVKLLDFLFLRSTLVALFLR